MPKHASLLPREHGAYAELLFPLGTGLALGEPNGPSLCFVIATTALFLLYEPVAVLSGVRGKRAKTDWSARARRRAAWLASVGVVAGAAAMATTTPAARWTALIPLACGAVLLPAFLSARLKNLASEVLVIAALSGAVLPTAVSAEAEQARAWTAFGVWLLSFSLSTVAVHAIKARAGTGPAGEQWTVPATPIFASVVGTGALLAVFGGAVPLTAGLALVPPLAVTVTTVLVSIHPRQLRRVGWALVASNTATLVLLVSG